MLFRSLLSWYQSSTLFLTMSTAPASSDGTSGAMASSGSASIAAIANLITIRLTRENFLLWKTQAVPVLRAQGSFGYVDGSIPAPPETITEGTGDAARVVANPAFLRWYQQDQVVLIALLSSMTEDIIGQLTQLHTSRAVWDALHCWKYAHPTRCSSGQ